jgi:5-methylcytosine-specific restriction endonuclease McrA
MLCAEAGCQAEVTRGRCANHAAAADRSHRRRHRDIYATKRWALTRRRKLSQNPICERCEEELATEVHHADGYEEPYALSGLEALCSRCHGRETRQEQLRR